MKRNILYILPILAALLSLSACSSDIVTTDAGAAKVPVNINATIGSPVTRSNPTGNQAAFNNGDVIFVSNYEDAKEYKYNGGRWVTADGSRELMAERGINTDFWAYYPSKRGNSYESGKVEADQNMAGLASSDYMTAKTSLDPVDDGTLNLAFVRKTAMVTVNIVKYNYEIEAGDKPLKSCQLVANLNVGDKAGKNIGLITMKKETDSKFVALVGPTASTDALEGQSDVNFLTFNFNKRSPLYFKTRSDLEAGKAYTFNVTVGKNNIALQSVTVEDFTQGETANGTAKENIALTHKSVVLGGEDINNYQSLKAWMNNNIDNATGNTLTLSGEWKDEYREAIRQFTNEHPNADLTVDLSNVTGLTSIPNFAFHIVGRANSPGLSGITLPVGVTSIGMFAFRSSGLKTINLPEGLTSIGNTAFGYTHIETLTVPSTMVNIGDFAFARMDQLKEIHFNGDVRSFGGTVFSYVSQLHIYLDKCTSVPQTTYTTFSYLSGPVTVYVKDEDMKKKFESSGWRNNDTGEDIFTYEVVPQ